MSIRPVDLQMVLPKSAEVSKMNEPIRPEVQQQQFQNQLQKQTAQEAQQVKTRTQVERVDKDRQQGGGRNQQSPKKKSSTKTGTYQQHQNPDGMSMVDISI